MVYRYKNTVYLIVVTQKNSAKEMMVTVDGVVQGDRMITLADDGVEHHVEVGIVRNHLLKTIEKDALKSFRETDTRLGIKQTFV